jgi:hypothetical protein
MAGFVDDLTDLDLKTTLRATRPGAEGHTIRAEDWNRVVNACYDLRTAVIAGSSIADGDKGDITVSGSGLTWTIDTNVVSLSKLAQIATARILGRTTALTGDVEALTGTEVTAMLDAFASGTKGLAPASGGGTTNFLRADGTWAVPSSTASSSLSAITVTTNTTSAHATVNLTTNGCREWMMFYGSTNAFAGYGPRQDATVDVRDYKLNRPRFWRGTHFYRTNASTVTVNAVGYGDPSITVAAADNNAGNTRTAVGITLTLATSSTDGHGIYFDLPMEAGETGTFGFACSQIHNLLTMSVELANGDASPVSNTFPNPGATRKYTLGTFTYTIGRATTMRVRLHTTSVTGSTEFGPAYVYL